MRTSLVLSILGLAGALAAPCLRASAQAMDSTGMPSLELLAREAGRESRRHPIRAVLGELLCDSSHPLVDSASLAACSSLASARASAIIAAFARGIEVPLAAPADSAAAAGFPTCPTDLDQVTRGRVLVARVTAPVVGVQDGKWEGRLMVEVRCRSPDARATDHSRTMSKEYLYQWDGRVWRLYQFAWLRGEL